MSEAPQGIIAEPQNETSLVNKIKLALEKSENRSHINERRRLKQEQILNKLPSDFEMDIKAFATYVGNEIDTHIEQYVAGEMFENLVRGDLEICPKEETEEAKLIRSVLKDPDMYNLKGIDRHMRNPDVAQINEEGEIVGAVEVKAGKINKRGIEQLNMFKGNLSALVDKLERTDPKILREHGLGLIADNLDKLKVADEFSVILAIPFGVSDGNVETLLKKEDFTSPEEIKKAKETLEKCKIIESPFSKTELRTISLTVTNWLQTQK
jgi:hypothetical protein